jgi:hypothetical protein
VPVDYAIDLVSDSHLEGNANAIRLLNQDDLHITTLSVGCIIYFHNAANQRRGIPRTLDLSCWGFPMVLWLLTQCLFWIPFGKGRSALFDSIPPCFVRPARDGHVHLARASRIRIESCR